MWNPIFSNFYLPSTHPGIIKGHIAYPTIEHFFVAMKTLDIADRHNIAAIRHPAEAKRYGNTVDLRSDWHKVRRSVMLYGLRQKFFYGEPFNLLLQTVGQTITHEVHWHDNFWAACVCPACADKPKHNLLGVLLMQVRDEFIANGPGDYLRNGSARTEFHGTPCKL